MKFTAACISIMAVASAQYRGDFGYGNPYGAGSLHGVQANIGKAPYGGYGSARPHSGYNEGNTYGHVKGLGYGIYNFEPKAKDLRGNDGYKLVRRSDPHERSYDDVYAKCIMSDQSEESYVNGVLYLAQAPKGENTKIWGGVSGVHHADLTINALGDVRDGCDSTGGVYNPNVTASGYDAFHLRGGVPGDLGSIGDGKVNVWADVDLSGNQNVIGRSMVVSVGDNRVACCQIGLSGGAKAPSKPKPAYNAGYGNVGYGQGYGRQGYGGGYY